MAPSETLEIYLIRHGATKLNSENGSGPDKIRGWKNVPLSPKGRQEAEKLGQDLENSGIKVIVHSDLDRASDTAEAVADTTGAKLVETDKLRPWNLGKFTGCESKICHPEIAHYAQKTPDKKVPEGESFNEFRDRAFEGLREAIEKSKGQSLAIVTHHRVERLIKAWQAAGEGPEHDLDFKVMFQHGEKPASSEKLKINVRNL